MLKKYSRCLDIVEKIFLYILGILISAMTIIMVYQVILRYIFHRPNVWAEEIVKFLFAWVCFVGAPLCMRHNSHLKVDFLLTKLPRGISLLWQTIIVLLSCVFCAILVPVSIPMVTKVISKHSLGANVPMWIPYSSVTFGCFFMLVFGIELFIKQLTEYIEYLREKKEGNK